MGDLGLTTLSFPLTAEQEQFSMGPYRSSGRAAHRMLTCIMHLLLDRATVNGRELCNISPVMKSWAHTSILIVLQVENEDMK